MSLLFDTHALLWWMNDDQRLSPRAREAIADGGTTVLFSPVNLYEVLFKAWLGKLDLSDQLKTGMRRDLLNQGFVELPLTGAHAARAALLEFSNRDPFNRLLIAQALEESAALLSNERGFDTTRVDRVW